MWRNRVLKGAFENWSGWELKNFQPCD